MRYIFEIYGLERFQAALGNFKVTEVIYNSDLRWLGSLQVIGNVTIL